MYLDNSFCQPNGVSLSGQDIDISRVDNPCYFISTEQDHIAKWKSTYYGALLPSGKTRFVLGGSGHIAGIVNPPAGNKYGYWTNDTLAPDPDAWLQAAEQHAGSWWPDWQQWVQQQSSEQVDARKPDANTILEAAPGSYVKRTIVDIDLAQSKLTMPTVPQ